MSENHKQSSSSEKVHTNSLSYSDEKTSNVDTSKTKSNRNSMKTANKHNNDKRKSILPPNNRTLSRLDVQRVGSHNTTKV